jgi:AraC-like DNA-binding protein
METHMYSTERYTTANMQVYLLRCLAAMSPGFGINPERLCLGLGFEIADLSDPECRLSFRQASEMIRRTIELAPGRGIGLEIASNETIGSIGLVGYAMLTSPTFGDAVALGVDMQEYAGSMLQLDYTHDESRMSISATSRFHEPDIEMFLVEEAFGSFMKIGHALLGDHFRPSSVELSYDRPSYADQYERTFGCPVLFGRKDNVFSCDASWSSKRIATYDPLSHRQAVNLLELARTQDSDDSDLIESVERIVRRDLRQTPPLAAIAAQLCMSERTLRRKMACCGVSYQSLLDGVRQRRASALLQNSRLSIEEIAYEVGFSDCHNFRRAFKRWTGHTPRSAV